MIPFTKAHACGNDFLIVTEDAAGNNDWATLTQRLCERNTGVGADGIEFFAWINESGINESGSDKSRVDPISGRIRLHNADGSIAEISGNGTRCVAAWMARERNLAPGDSVEITTDAGVRICRINSLKSDGEFIVDVTTGMGIPEFGHRAVVLSDGSTIEGIEVSTGNPHFVIPVNNLDFNKDGQGWMALGAEICTHPDFPNQTNVEFVRIVSPSEIEIRIFERGVGPTTSSGTGTSASATAAIAVCGCTSPLTVVAPGGPQIVAWSGVETELYLTGPAALIARGEAW